MKRKQEMRRKGEKTARNRDVTNVEHDKGIRSRGAKRAWHVTDLEEKGFNGRMW